MPVYDFQCDGGHKFEAFSHVSNFNRRRACPVCRKRSRRVDFLTAPALAFTLAAVDRDVYLKHNVVHTGQASGADGGFVRFRPNSHADQCQCGNCSSHRKRAMVTETADVGKDVSL